MTPQEKKKQKDALYYQSNKEKIRAASAAWREKNKDKVTEYSAQYYEENKGRRKAQQLAWRESNRDQRREAIILWKRGNPALVNAQRAKRRAAELSATPAWADEFLISEIYDLRMLRNKATGIDWHVDHIVPLRSELVCGLHCEFNLQVLPSVENIKKSNRHWPDMP